MRVCVALVIGLVSASAVAALVSSHEAFNPQEAYTYTAEIAGYGERWPGSPGHEKTEELIHRVLTKDHAQIEADDFFAATPRGPVPVHNIIGSSTSHRTLSSESSSLPGITTLSLSLDSSAQTTERRALPFFSPLPT